MSWEFKGLIRIPDLNDADCFVVIRCGTADSFLTIPSAQFIKACPGISNEGVQAAYDAITAIAAFRAALDSNELTIEQLSNDPHRPWMPTQSALATLPINCIR